MKVVKIQDYKDSDMYKIDGEAFAKIKVLKDKHRETFKALEEAHSKQHEELWAAIYEVIGKKSKQTLSLDVEYEELGFYVVKKTDKSPIRSLLDALKD